MKKFAKIIDKHDGGQLLATNLYDSDEDMYVVKISHFTKEMGGCFQEMSASYAEESEADEAFDNLEIEKLKALI